ncbi:serine/threonine protein phosphatase PPT1 [Talaromyces proteolyticus]|uniref:Serine/threonine-protein phosphatase n=1 Tax=Talaromyces proteolyticus TaxID=1131652 RepID=A0AAD4Q4B1_9EURO|nr:serine/threonine protein phosphatase PPT1 [Talaromyces proteolyticus]KAH8702546.1 serine/threonine protein phosphatase PPT1 [Talaromyces proteolyticus]
MTSSAADAASALKQQGNKAFAKHDWPTAIDFYSQAIDKYDKEPSFFSNRAQAHIKLEAYGYAIADATKALELDPSYVKAYWRRALANTAILNPRAALKDFRSVIKKEPNNRDAKLKLAECEKLVRRMDFEKAIEVAEPASVFEDLDIESIIVEDSYDGVHLGEEMTQEFIDDMLERFKNGKKIHRKYVFQIIKNVLDLVKAEPTMVEIGVDQGTKLTICGDTHGQYFDLLEIFRLNGYPSDTHAYLFNGDFVDRGSWSTEIALLLYAYKWLRPQKFFLNRGNHETDDMNKVYGFEGECKAKYSENVFKVFSESFSALPLATLVGDKYFVLHGGLFSDDNISLDDIRKLNRHNQRQPGQSGLMMEMLWTDPQPAPGRGPSKRGVGLQFGPDVTKRFCERNGLEAVIRSHEVRMGGYEVEHDGRCITVFSAPRYCDATENKGAYINVGPELKLEYHVFDAVPHPDIKPMYLTSDPTSFASVSVRERWPVILTGAIDDLHRTVSQVPDAENEKQAEGKSIIEELAKLKYEVQHDRKLTPLVDDGEPDIADYNKDLEQRGNPSWHNVPWLYSECYLYRRIATFFNLSKYWKGYDVFSRQKISTFKSSRPAVLELAARYKSLALEVEKGSQGLSPAQVEDAERLIFTEMCEICLWGNATDLSLLTTLTYEDIQKLQGSQARKASEKNIIVNDTNAAYDALRDARKEKKDGERRVDIVLDNAGFELFVDLILAGYLLSAGLATTVVLRPKVIPWFVSDVIPKDFADLLNALANPQAFYTAADDSGQQHAPLSEREVEEVSFLFGQWSQFHAEGKLVLRPHRFWTGPGSFWRLPYVAPGLYEDLKTAELVLFKGDLNYRKLTNDAAWDPTTPFTQAIGPLGPKSGVRILSFRTCKADVVVGLAPGEDERLRQVPGGGGDSGARKWAWSGKWAVVSFSDGKT